MKSNLVLAALASAVFALSSTVAFAAPVIAASVAVVVDVEHLIAHGATNADGTVTFRDLAPGKYTLVIDGPALVKAIDRLQPPAPAITKSGLGQLSLGFGGFSGGGGSSRREGAGPIGGQDRSSNSHSGVGFGASVAVADINGDGKPDFAAHNGNAPSLTISIIGGSVAADVTTPYCRENGGGDVRFGFKIAENESPRPQDVTATLSWDFGDGTSR